MTRGRSAETWFERSILRICRRIARYLPARHSPIPEHRLESVALEVFTRLQHEDSASAIKDPARNLFRLADKVAAEQDRASSMAPLSGSLVESYELESSRARAVFDGFPQSLREVVLLHFTSNLSYTQISELTGESPEEILKQLTKAYVAFRMALVQGQEG